MNIKILLLIDTDDESGVIDSQAMLGKAIDGLLEQMVERGAETVRVSNIDQEFDDPTVEVMVTADSLAEAFIVSDVYVNASSKEGGSKEEVLRFFLSIFVNGPLAEQNIEQL